MKNKKKVCLLLFLLLLIDSSVSAETIKLKSGKTVEGKIVTMTDKYIKVDIGINVNIMYFLDEIEKVDKGETEDSQVEDYTVENEHSIKRNKFYPIPYQPNVNKLQHRLKPNFKTTTRTIQFQKSALKLQMPLQSKEEFLIDAPQHDHFTGEYQLQRDTWRDAWRQRRNSWQENHFYRK
ncbi:MAG: hypothetical protein KJ593_04830 [Candidatus Omnitrophica bacterium]|nr:hypothetical protein [Candidatus Omnitrophota bacterium]